MKFTINAGQLLRSLDNIQGIIDKKNITPILSNVRLSVENNKILINATDMDLDIVEILDVKVETQGSTTAPALILFETTKKLPSNADIEFSLDNDKLNIRCGKFKGSLNCLSVDDFPVIQNNDLPNNFSLPCESLKHLIEQTKFAMSSDETRYYLNGIYLHTTENKNKEKILRSVSTDGHRLALCDVPLNSDIDMSTGIIIPKKAVDELSKLLDKVQQDNVTIASSTTRICFKFDTLVLTSKLIDGNFPNYNKVIPENNDKLVEVSKTDFSDAIDIVSMYSDDKLKFVKIDFSPKKMKLTAHKSVGSAEQELDAGTSIEEMSICFNARYIKDICTLIKTTNLVMHLGTENSPALVKKEGDDNELFVVMPMRL